MKTLYLVREDLRLYDNPALCAAAENGEFVVLFVQPDGLGAASQWWLHHSLTKFTADLDEFGIPVILRRGDPVETVLEIAAKIDAEQVVWNRVYSPNGIELGKALKEALEEAGVKSCSYNAQLLIEPTQVLTQQETPYKVFTPFWRACKSQLEPAEPLPVPSLSAAKNKCSVDLESDNLQDWKLLPTSPDWSGGLAERWQPGEAGGQVRWQVFLDGVINEYKNGRDIPSAESTSFLSPHLAFGEISVRQIWHETHAGIAEGRVNESDGHKFLSEIGWREFSRYLLVHFPSTTQDPFNDSFKHFPWQDDERLLKKWQQGTTGYPIVDAGMRELWQTGYMHNRVRMVVASFLTKHCLTHWHHGMAWFWDTLVDADIGNNTASWQWAAGCGADAAPYFRIFNPVLQSEKFDKQGKYLRRWVPELAEMPDKWIHKPWDAPDDVLEKAAVKLGVDYPNPCVDHKAARQAALDAYQEFRDK